MRLNVVSTPASVVRRPGTGVALGAAAAVLNLSFVFEWLLPGGTNVGGAVVSDLSIRARPWSWAFRGADALSAVCVIVLTGLCLVALRARPHEPRGRPLWLAAWTLTAVFAVSTLLAALVTETCARDVAPRCPAGQAAPTADLVHDVISSAGSTAAVLAALAFAVAVRATTRLALAHGLCFVVAAASGLLFVATQARPDDDLSGWVQRVQIIALSAWLVVVGVTADRQWLRAASSGRAARERMRA